MIIGGYMYILSPQHPNKTQMGYVAEHRIVMEERLGRYLEKKEAVHHIDGNTLNNNIINLFLYKTNGYHTAKEHTERDKLGRFTPQRVLKSGCSISGCVPVAGTSVDFRDPTHKRHFVIDTFSYFCGQAEWTEKIKPKHPKYADYGFLVWEPVDIKQEVDLIYFKMTPIK